MLFMPFVGANSIKDLRQISCVISGRVQGVGFRAAVRKNALKLGLLGWVSNLEDGSVRCRAVGQASGIEQFIEFLSRGPILAKVEKVTLEEIDDDEVFEDFVVIK